MSEDNPGPQRASEEERERRLRKELVPLSEFSRGPLVFHADVLGMTNATIEPSGQLAALEKLLRLYKSAARLFHGARGDNPWHLYLFSDTLLVSGFSAGRDMPSLCKFAEDLFTQALEDEILLRGAFTFGEFWDLTTHLEEIRGPNVSIGAVVGRGWSKAIVAERMLPGMRIGVEDSFARRAFPEGALRDLEKREERHGRYPIRIRGEFVWWRHSPASAVEKVERLLANARGALDEARRQVDAGGPLVQLWQFDADSLTKRVEHLAATLDAMRL